MKNWLFIIFALVIQELVSLNAVLFEVHQQHFHVWLIHILFMVATVVDIIAGFFIGKYVQKKLTHGRIFTFAEKWSARFHSFAGKRGKWFALLLLGNFSFPYLNAFIAAWLDISFIESLIFLFIGNMLWYITLWLFMLGVVSVIPNASIALGVIIAVMILIVILVRKFKIRKI